MRYFGLIFISLLFSSCFQTGATPVGNEKSSSSVSSSDSTIVTAAPIVTSVSPASGDVGGGTSITINGFNFENGATVLLDGLSCLNATNTSTKIYCTSSAHAAAGVTLRVMNSGGKYIDISSGFTYEAQVGTWSTAPTTTNAPSVRRYHTAVWTGTYMIIWGGYSGSALLNTGAKYDPTTDTWTTVTTTGAPSARINHTAVWSGTEMIIWGGHAGTTATTTGGKYDPATDTWTATETVGAPSARKYHTAVWTGTQMIIWGGVHPLTGTYYSNGYAMTPGAPDMWAAISNTSAPSARIHHTAIWTGAKMVIWGGTNGTNYYSTGASYTEATDTWAATSTTSAPTGRAAHTAIWDGTYMVVWGGITLDSTNPTNFMDPISYLSSGGRYNVATNTWTATSSTGAPTGRAYHSATYNGAHMIVWGGNNKNGFLQTGGRYDIMGATWGSLSTGTDVPSARAGHTAIYDGTNVYMWGGQGESGNLRTGGKF